MADEPTWEQRAKSAEADLIDVMAQAEAVQQDIGRLCYRGNSVAHWVTRAQARGKGLDDAWKALQELGIHPDGKLDVAAAIRLLATRSKSDNS